MNERYVPPICLRKGGAHVAGRDQLIEVRVTGQQKEQIKEGARSLGMNVSEFVLRATDAYLAAAGDASSVVAVSYGEWLLVYHGLADVAESLRNCAMQVGAMRRAMSSISQDGHIPESLARNIATSLEDCRYQISRTRSPIAKCIDEVEGMRHAFVATNADSAPLRLQAGEG